MKSKKSWVFMLVALLFCAVLIGDYLGIEIAGKTVYRGYIAAEVANPQVKNIVTSIYLNYRVFDTMFEALLLLVSIVAVFQFTNLKRREKNYQGLTFLFRNTDHFKLPRYIMSIVYPLFVIFGIYLIANGADSPGGGFQGGAVLAVLFISRYLVSSNYQYRANIPYVTEKILYLFIVILTAMFLLSKIAPHHLRLYMLIMNTLIGLKVASGFTAIFIQLVRGEE